MRARVDLVLAAKLAESAGDLGHAQRLDFLEAVATLSLADAAQAKRQLDQLRQHTLENGDPRGAGDAWTASLGSTTPRKKSDCHVPYRGRETGCETFPAFFRFS